MKRTPSRNDNACFDTLNNASQSHRAKYASAIITQTFRKTSLVFLLAVPLTIAWTTISDAGIFVFDQRRTEVRFAYKMAYATQRGRFTKVRGTLDYDEAAPGKSKVDALISTASLTTGEALIDSELKGAGFFNVEASPVIRFRSVTVQSGSTAAAADVLGEVTVNGITKPVTLKVSIMPHNDPALKYDKGAHKFIATTRIQRSAFNMTGYQAMVDDDVDIEINAIVRPK